MPLWRTTAKQIRAYGLKVTICYYPPGASKWNPIEHRLFSQISNNWSGRPLASYETVLNYIRTTETGTRLKVRARLLRKKYEKGEKVGSPQESGKSLQLTGFCERGPNACGGRQSGQGT